MAQDLHVPGKAILADSYYAIPQNGVMEICVKVKMVRLECRCWGIRKYSKSFVTLCYLVLPYFIFGLSALPALPHKVVLPCVSLKKELEVKKIF
jgi:hypothetical protein